MKLFGALRHPSEPRVLLLRSDRSWRLPRTTARGVWFAKADAIGDAFERRLGTRPWLLRQLRFDDGEAVLELELVDRSWTPPAHGRWAGRSELDGIRLGDEAERRLLREYLGALEAGDAPSGRPPWALPGWRERVLRWLETEVGLLGHRLTGIEQLKQWSISVVLRVHTDGPLLYLKAPARLPLFVEEGRVTAELAERFPGHVPAPLAVEPGEGWFLLPDLGEPVGWGAPLETGVEMLRRFAVLQRRSAAMTEELLAVGCHDRRLHVLEAQVAALVGDPAAVAGLTPAEADELRRRVPDLEGACRRLAALGLPATLVHGDLHLDNVARHAGELVYFDWTDACVAHPFFDLLSLRWERDEARRTALLDAYLAGWEGAASEERLREAAVLAAVVTPLHHAVSYQHIVAALEPASKAELDLTHQFLRDALEKLRGLPDA